MTWKGKQTIEIQYANAYYSTPCGNAGNAKPWNTTCKIKPAQPEKFTFKYFRVRFGPYSAYTVYQYVFSANWTHDLARIMLYMLSYRNILVYLVTFFSILSVNNLYICVWNRPKQTLHDGRLDQEFPIRIHKSTNELMQIWRDIIQSSFEYDWSRGGWGKWNINFLSEKMIPTGEWEFLHSLQYTGSYLEAFLWAGVSY